MTGSQKVFTLFFTRAASKRNLSCWHDSKPQRCLHRKVSIDKEPPTSSWTMSELWQLCPLCQSGKKRQHTWNAIAYKENVANEIISYNNIIRYFTYSTDPILEYIIFVASLFSQCLGLNQGLAEWWISAYDVERIKLKVLLKPLMEIA